MKAARRAFATTFARNSSAREHLSVHGTFPASSTVATVPA